MMWHMWNKMIVKNIKNMSGLKNVFMIQAKYYFKKFNYAKKPILFEQHLHGTYVEENHRQRKNEPY